mgnify:CR=1 FL=1
MITFGEKLRYLRRKNNLTQKELGMAVGFSENTADVRIAQYETNARMPREELLRKLAQVLGVQKEILTVPVLTKPKEFFSCLLIIQSIGAVIPSGI